MNMKDALKSCLSYVLCLPFWKSICCRKRLTIENGQGVITVNRRDSFEIHRKNSSKRLSDMESGKASERTHLKRSPSKKKVSIQPNGIWIEKKDEISSVETNCLQEVIVRLLPNYKPG